MALPDYQALFLPLLRFAADGETTVMGVLDRLADEFGLSESEREALLPSGRQRILHNRTHWARFYLTKAGLLSAEGRGKFGLTDTGREVLASAKDRLTTKDLLRYPSFQRFHQNSEAAADPVQAAPVPDVGFITPEERIDAAQLEMARVLRAELLDRILQSTPVFFEQVVIDLLVAMGYGGSRASAAERLGRAGDGGVDGVINEDALGLDRIYIQAKRFATGAAVGRPDVQAFLGSLVGHGATKGVFVTTASFTGHAIDFAERVPQRIVLIDGSRLTALMVQHGVGIRTTRSIDISRLDEDYFNPE